MASFRHSRGRSANAVFKGVPGAKIYSRSKWPSAKSQKLISIT